MAIYVSKNAHLLVVVRNPKTVITAAGEPVQTITRLTAQFQRGNAGDEYTQQAFERLDFGAVPEGLPVGRKTGVFDSALAQIDYGWTDEERKIVEDALDRMQGNEAGFIRVEQRKIEAPWPAIEKLRPHGRRTNEIAAEKIIDAAHTFGADLDEVADYLRQEDWPKPVVDAVREHAARDAVDEAVEELVEA